MTQRWELRFDNFMSMLVRLRTTVASASQRDLNDAEQAGLVQQFEICRELGWKTLRDFLADGGAPVKTPVPANVIRAAFDMGLITDGDGWIAAMKARNTAAHAYDPDQFVAIAREIVERFAQLLGALAVRLETERGSA